MAKRNIPLVDELAISNGDKRTVANACVKVFDRIQSWPAHEQALALGCAFVVFCEAANLDGRNVLNCATNLMRDSMNSSGRDHRFDAMKWHLRTEVFA